MSLKQVSGKMLSVKAIKFGTCSLLSPYVEGQSVCCCVTGSEKAFMAAQVRLFFFLHVCEIARNPSMDVVGGVASLLRPVAGGAACEL